MFLDADAEGVFNGGDKNPAVANLAGLGRLDDGLDGLRRTRAKLVVADEAPWIWNVAQDRRVGATEVLGFYHASLYLWDLGRLVQNGDEAATRSGSNRAATNCATGASNRC